MAKNGNNWIIFVMGLAAAAGAYEPPPEWFEPVAPPETEPIYGEVIVDALNLRDAPNLDAEKIGLLRRDDRVELIGWNVGNSESYDPYIWVEIETDQGRGFAAAYRREDWGFEREEQIPREDYLTWVHDFGEYQLSRHYDLDGDGTKEYVFAGPDGSALRYRVFEDCMGTENHQHIVPLVLTIEGSLDYQLELTEVFSETYLQSYVWEGYPWKPGVANNGSWSFYELVWEDFDGDGARELGLEYGYERHGHSNQPLNPDLHCWTWFNVEGEKLSVLLSWVEYLCEPQNGADDGCWKSGAWSVRGEMTPRTDGLTYHARIAAYLYKHSGGIVLPMQTIRTLGPWDRVGHTLFPPNYLSAGESWTFEMELEYLPELDAYFLVCPPDNGYDWRVFNLPCLENTGQLVHYRSGVRGDWDSVTITEPDGATARRLPRENETVVFRVEAGDYLWLLRPPAGEEGPVIARKGDELGWLTVMPAHVE